MHAVKCEICGRSFAAKAPNTKYCSYECRSLADRLRRRSWIKANPTYNADYYRKRKAEENANV